MKKVFFATLAVVLLSSFTAFAGTIDITAADLIGFVDPGSPADPSDETIYANKLIDLYNTYGSTYGPVSFDSHSYTISAGLNVPGGLLPAAVHAGKDESAPFEITSSYEYAIFKLGNVSYLYWLDGKTGTVDQFGDRLSHVSVFNPITVPEPSLIMLLGFGLGAVGLVSRRKK